MHKRLPVLKSRCFSPHHVVFLIDRVRYTNINESENSYERTSTWVTQN